METSRHLGKKPFTTIPASFGKDTVSMTSRRIVVGVLTFLVASVTNADVSRDVRAPFYQRGDGGETVECQGLPVRNMCGSEKAPSLIYYDCSDGKFNCVFDTHNVIAVPKAGLALGQRYSSFGADLIVERCFGLEGRCDIALVTSTCAVNSVCECRFMEGDPSSITFVYSREKGVTAFYTLRDAKELSKLGVDAELVVDTLPLLTFVLVAEEGLLKAELSLTRAVLRTQCSQS